jgi:hypothetical protein
MRKITCPDCGAAKPTPREDAAQGLYERRIYGTLLGSAMCDYCGKELERGDGVIALSIPSDMPYWESTYMEISQ